MLVDPIRYIDAIEEAEKVHKWLFDEERETLFKLRNQNIEDSSLATEVYNSFVISIYGKMESSLTTVCIIMQRAVRINLSYKDLRNSGIENALNYLIGLDMLTTNFKKTPKHKRIEHWKHIRNHIAHNLGYIKTKEELFNALEDIAMNYNSDTDKVMATLDDIQTLLNDFETFFKELFEEMYSRLHDDEDEDEAELYIF